MVQAESENNNSTEDWSRAVCGRRTGKGGVGGADGQMLLWPGAEGEADLPGGWNVGRQKDGCQARGSQEVPEAGESKAAEEQYGGDDQATRAVTVLHKSPPGLGQLDSRRVQDGLTAPN